MIPLSLRVNPENPNHHLWNNNGTWWCHYTVHPTPVTKQRVRVSLETKDKFQARWRRDALLSVSPIGRPEFARSRFGAEPQVSEVRS